LVACFRLHARAGKDRNGTLFMHVPTDCVIDEEKLIMQFDFGVIEIASRLLVGGAIGFCIGLTGVGGGILMLPALTLLFGMDPVTAVGTASFYSFLTKASATWHHVKLKTIEWKIALRFLVGAVPANIGIALWITSWFG